MRPLRALARVPLLAAPALTSLAAVTAQVAPDVARRIVDQGIAHSEVMAFEDALCHDYGSRLTGSLAFERAAEWARQQFAAMGLDARLEPWGEWQCGWDREQWQGRVVSPAPFELQVACPAWTGCTRGLARGTLVRMPASEADVVTLSARAAKDGPFWLWGAMPKEPELYDAVHVLFDLGKALGLAQSAKSTGWNDKAWENQIRVFGDHKRAQRPFAERARWAHAVVRDDQSALIERELAGDLPVVVEFELRNRWRPGPVKLCNVVAELKGSARPDEVVIVCAHLDSWHQATGATDNGTGVCSTLEAARILTASGCKPRRTVRFILWSGEEEGLLGSHQYVVQHRAQMPLVSAVFNHDSGTNWAQGLTVAESEHADFARIVQPILDLMHVPQEGSDKPVFELGKVAVLKPAAGGSDHASFGAVGVPAFGWRLQGEVPYGRGWHSQWDTYSIVVPRYQQQTATVIALVAEGVAELDHLLSRQGVERANAGGAVNAQLIVETWLGIELDGLACSSVAPGGIAAEAGLAKGDQFAAVGDETVHDAKELLAALRAASAAEGAIKITIARAGETLVKELVRR
jgi:hypothetical protein